MRFPRLFWLLSAALRSGRLMEHPESIAIYLANDVLMTV